jgi:hypothetical protein
VICGSWIERLSLSARLDGKSKVISAFTSLFYEITGKHTAKIKLSQQL